MLKWWDSPSTNHVQKRPFVKRSCISGIFLLLLKVNQKGKLSLPTVTDCSTALTGRLFSFWIGNWITYSNSSFENCKTMFLFPLQHVPNYILFIAQFQSIVLLLHTHTEHLGFWNSFSPISGWLEQPMTCFPCTSFNNIPAADSRQLGPGRLHCSFQNSC